MAAETRRTAGTWVLAGGAAALAAAHVLMLLALPHSPGWVIALGVMTLWCLKCSVDALRTGQLLGLLLMSAAMGIAHVVMVLGLPLGHAGHGAHAAASGGHADGHLWMLVIALAEFTLMFGCALGISTGRRVRRGAPQHPERARRPGGRAPGALRVLTVCRPPRLNV